MPGATPIAETHVAVVISRLCTPPQPKTGSAGDHEGADEHAERQKLAWTPEVAQKTGDSKSDNCQQAYADAAPVLLRRKNNAWSGRLGHSNANPDGGKVRSPYARQQHNRDQNAHEIHATSSRAATPGS